MIFWQNVRRLIVLCNGATLFSRRYSRLSSSLRRTVLQNRLFLHQYTRGAEALILHMYLQICVVSQHVAKFTLSSVWWHSCAKVCSDAECRRIDGGSRGWVKYRSYFHSFKDQSSWSLGENVGHSLWFQTLYSTCLYHIFIPKKFSIHIVENRPK